MDKPHLKAVIVDGWIVWLEGHIERHRARVNAACIN